MLTKEQYDILSGIQEQYLRFLENARAILLDADIDPDGDTVMAVEDALDEYEGELNI